MRLDDHPSVKRFESRRAERRTSAPAGTINADTLRALCLRAGADDVGFVSIARPELDRERADAGSARRYREQVSSAETSSMWQSLAYGPNYKSAYCMAVCPAGDDVIAPFLEDRARFVKRVVEPLKEKREAVYVVANSDAESHVRRRFPHKKPRRVHNGLRARSIANFLAMLPVLFQRGQAGDLAATYHFRFTGEEPRDATVVIRGGEIHVEHELAGHADLTVTADGPTWLRFLSGDASLLWSLVRRRIRLKGTPRLLSAFGRCFPS